MKIFKEKENTVLLQGYEAVYIAFHPQKVPDLLLKEISNFLKSQVLSGAANSNRFNCVISEPQNVAWLMDQNWIVDFDQFSKLTPDELAEIISDTKDEFLSKIAKFNAQSKSFRDKNFAAVGEIIEQKRHQVLSLELMLQYLKGEIKFVFRTVEEPVPSYPVYYDVFKDDYTPSPEPRRSKSRRPRRRRSFSIFRNKAKRRGA